MRISRAADYRSMPWKNGAGTTTVIAVFPEGATLDDFDWRISRAKVAAPGAFSAFPSVNRTLCLLSGEGVMLKVSGQGRRKLDVASPPFTFSGDTPVDAEPIGGAVEDLNVMTRRGRVSHRVEKIGVRSTVLLRRNGEDVLILHACGAPLRVRSDDGTADLRPNDTVLLDSRSPSAIEVSSAESAEFFRIDLQYIR
ncbi:HutD family protein [Microvirga brassicacearum]|uniref:HutD family protein n=1 Tax=Microvirga brassicacearum TaxID=2580413 RepID=A0A5N3PBU7_9HYPH|nr:HutD family protein [Microvirga brassicacearum]KAB0267227.1 HutD family protein [Microvirga brassicacearum]